MSIDLYTDDIGGLSPQGLYEALVLFTRINEPIENRPQESYLLDYKAKWEDTALEVVAAFSNSFGGLLLVGVEEKGGQPIGLVGVHSKAELKTRIASSIASNISPTPSFAIGDCYPPGEDDKRFCVVRVRKGSQLHFLTKKGAKSPVYVRNEDEARPADASQLKALIEQTSNRPEAEAKLPQRYQEWQSNLFVTERSPLLHGPNDGVRATNALTVTLLPLFPPKISMDLELERTFNNIVRSQFLRFYQRAEGGPLRSCLTGEGIGLKCDTVTGILFLTAGGG